MDFFQWLFAFNQMSDEKKKHESIPDAPDPRIIKTDEYRGKEYFEGIVNVEAVNVRTRPDNWSMIGRVLNENDTSLSIP